MCTLWTDCCLLTTLRFSSFACTSWHCKAHWIIAHCILTMHIAKCINVLHIAVHGNRVKPQSNSVATIFHSHSQRHSKHWLPSVFKGCHHQAILMTDKNGLASSVHHIMHSCRVSGVSGRDLRLGPFPMFLVLSVSALVFGIVLMWEEKIYSFEVHTKYERCQTPFNVECERSRNLDNSQNQALDWVFFVTWLGVRLFFGYDLEYLKWWL